MSDDEPPTSSDLRDIIDEALSQTVARPPWWQRLRLWLSRQRSKIATMGGYWGGVILHGLRRAGAAAAAFLRRR